MILDTSVVLNLLASGGAARVLESLGDTFWVPTQVVREVKREPDPSPAERSTLRYLLRTGLVREYTPTGDVLDTVLDLVGASGLDGLEDGEAATIAVAEALDCVAALDERKGRRIANARRALHPPLCSVELFRALDGRGDFRDGELCELVFNALHLARMRVLHPHIDWVVELIGRERAAQCPSLPAKARG